MNNSEKILKTLSDLIENGILTSKDEWCTDACGVASIDVVPLCMEDDNEVSILMQSGLVSKMVKIKVVGTGLSEE